MARRGVMVTTPTSMPTKGFTLIEVLLVVVIVAILAGVVVMHMNLDQGRHVLHESARVLSQSFVDEYCEMEAEVPQSVLSRLAPFIIRE